MIKIVLKRFSKMIFPRYGKYSLLILKNRIKKIVNIGRKHKYLFILSPPFCGSTLLNELISSSNSVSVNNPFGTREGQQLPTVRQTMFDNKKRWDITLDFNWEDIKKEWMKYWDLSYPILLEKSPPNIIRTKSIVKTFNPSYFIIFYRNPYAHCESLIRRNNVKPSSAAEFAIKSLEYQMKNISELDNAVQISYELLTEQTETAISLMAELLPELNDMQGEQEFSAHSYLSKNMKIQNLNEDKISKLTIEQLEEINVVFSQKREILNFFEYRLIDIEEIRKLPDLSP